MDSGSFVTGVLLHPPARKLAVGNTQPGNKTSHYICVYSKTWAVNLCNRNYFYLKKCAVCIEAMAAANFSRNVLDMFYGSIPSEAKQRLEPPIRPKRGFDFEIVINNFDGWLNVWRMDVPEGHMDLLKFFQKMKTRYFDVCEHEVAALKSVKIQFGLLASFYMNQDEEVQHMEHYFEQKPPMILNEHNIDTLNHMINEWVNKVKDEIESWSQKGSGWVFDEILIAYINVARYQPLQGGSYMPLPKNLQNKKGIINVQNRDDECLKWALRAALFPLPPGVKVTRTSI